MKNNPQEINMAVATKATGKAFVWTLVIIATAVAIWLNTNSIVWGLTDLGKFLVDRFVDTGNVLSPIFANPWITTKYVVWLLILCVLVLIVGGTIIRVVGTNDDSTDDDSDED